MLPQIIILEDNATRTEMMKDALATYLTHYQLHILPSAPEMIAHLQTHPDNIHMIILDHDLEPQPGATEDPGDGRDVLHFIVAHVNPVPVVIHSTNYPAAMSMLMELQDHHWPAQRVSPTMGFEWIHDEWIEVVSQLL